MLHTGNGYISYFSQQHDSIHVDPEVSVVRQVKIQVQGPQPGAVIFQLPTEEPQVGDGGKFRSNF